MLTNYLILKTPTRKEREYDSGAKFDLCGLISAITFIFYKPVAKLYLYLPDITFNGIFIAVKTIIPREPFTLLNFYVAYHYPRFHFLDSNLDTRIKKLDPKILTVLHG